MPRVAAGSAGPGWGCTCPSSLKQNQILTAMGRASLVSVEYRYTQEDGTMVFHTWSTPTVIYRVTFHPAKPGKICKHAIACSSHVVGDWLTTGLEQLRKELNECQAVKKENQKLHKNLVAAAQTMLETKPVMPSDT